MPAGRASAGLAASRLPPGLLGTTSSGTPAGTATRALDLGLTLQGYRLTMFSPYFTALTTILPMLW